MQRFQIFNIHTARVVMSFKAPEFFVRFVTVMMGAKYDYDTVA